MWITAPHDCTAVLENLHRPDVWLTSKFAELLGPGIDHATQLWCAHSRHREIVARRITDYTTASRFTARNQKSSFLDFCGRSFWCESWKIVVKNKRPGVGGISRAASSHIARAKVTIGIESQLRLGRNALNLPLPWTLRSVRGNQHPLPLQRIEAAMGMRRQIR